MATIIYIMGVWDKKARVLRSVYMNFAPQKTGASLESPGYHHASGGDRTRKFENIKLSRRNSKSCQDGKINRQRNIKPKINGQ